MERQPKVEGFISGYYSKTLEDILQSEKGWLHVSSPEETKALAANFAAGLKPGDVAFIVGELGAGKTTFVRGILESLGHIGPVRSPTFNLLQVFETDPPVLHADLYRLQSARGIGIEDYLDSHVVLIEWPKNDPFLIPSHRIEIEFDDDGRRISILRANAETGGTNNLVNPS